mgnify:CR=1 FL=1
MGKFLPSILVIFLNFWITMLMFLLLMNFSFWLGMFRWFRIWQMMVRFFIFLDLIWLQRESLLVPCLNFWRLLIRLKRKSLFVTIAKERMLRFLFILEIRLKILWLVIMNISFFAENVGKRGWVERKLISDEFLWT